jgi:transketolase
VGYALGARFKGKLNHTWVMVGDGEIQEGMIWEAVHVAARYRLGGLTLIVDCNGLQQYGWPHEVPASLDHRSHGDRRDPWAGTDLPAIFDAFGWNVTEFDGHDHVQIQQAYSMAGRRPHDAPPTVLLARTVKGKGVSFTEHSYKWHAQVPSAAELMQAGAELGFGTDQ